MSQRPYDPTGRADEAATAMQNLLTRSVEQNDLPGLDLPQNVVSHWTVEYSYQGKVFSTVVDALTAEGAMARFNHENRHVRAVNAFQ